MGLIKIVFNGAPSKPGIGTSEASRQIPSTTIVNKIRDFSSGILKQLLSVLRIEENIDYSGGRLPAGSAGFAALATTSHVPPLRFQSWSGRGAESVRSHRQFPGQFARAQDLDPLAGPVGQAEVAQRAFVHGRAVVKLVERFQVHRNVTDGETLC